MNAPGREDDGQEFVRPPCRQYAKRPSISLLGPVSHALAADRDSMEKRIACAILPGNLPLSYKSARFPMSENKPFPNQAFRDSRKIMPNIVPGWRHASHDVASCTVPSRRANARFHECSRDVLACSA